MKSQFEIEWNRFLSVFQSLQNEEKIRCTFIHCDPVLFKLENTKIFFYGFTFKKKLYFIVKDAAYDLIFFPSKCMYVFAKFVKITKKRGILLRKGGGGDKGII